MQKGIATLEIILFTMTISLLTVVTLPNLGNIMDKATLDYEVKRIYTRLRFLQSFDRLTTMKDTHFHTANTKDTVSLRIPNNSDYYIIEKNAIYKETYETYHLAKGFKLSYKNKSVAPDRIQFDYMGKEESGKSYTLKTTSRLGKTFYFYFTTVGRFTADRVDRYQ